MLTGLILNVLLTFINYILGLLPTTALNSTITTSITNFVNYVYQFNEFFPIDTAMTLLGYTVAFWLIVFTWDIFKWFIHLIRGN